MQSGEDRREHKDRAEGTTEEKKGGGRGCYFKEVCIDNLTKLKREKLEGLAKERTVKPNGLVAFSNTGQERALRGKKRGIISRVPRGREGGGGWGRIILIFSGENPG